MIPFQFLGKGGSLAKADPFVGGRYSPTLFLASAAAPALGGMQGASSWSQLLDYSSTFINGIATVR